MKEYATKCSDLFMMELQQLTSLPFIITFLLVLLVLVKQSIKSKIQTSNSPLPPGPSKLPFIGHLHHLLSGLPHHSFQRLATIHGPLMHLRLGEISAVVISSSAVAKEMMTTHDLNFADRINNLALRIMSYGCKDLAMAPYGEYWRHMRKICILELLSARRVESFWSMREDEVSKLVAKISSKAGSAINPTQDILKLTTDITSRATFGKTCKNKEAFLLSLKEQVRLASGFAIHDLFPSLKFVPVMSGIKSKLEKMAKVTDNMLEDIISEHKMTTKVDLVEEDLVDVLLRVQEGREITIVNVKAVLIDMFTAGLDTSATTLEWAFSELIRNPRVMKKTQDEVRQIFRGKRKVDREDMHKLNYLRLVIKESLRLHPPGPLLVPRVCRERCEMAGYVMLETEFTTIRFLYSCEEISL